MGKKKIEQKNIKFIYWAWCYGSTSRLLDVLQKMFADMRYVPRVHARSRGKDEKMKSKCCFCAKPGENEVTCLADFHHSAAKTCKPTCQGWGLQLPANSQRFWFPAAHKARSTVCAAYKSSAKKWS